MSVLDCFRSALDSLRGNILRTVLTTLGIVIGVGAVIAMVAIGAGARARVESVIQNLGANVLIVVNGSSTGGGARRGAGTSPALTEADAVALAREIPAVEMAAPAVQGSGQVVFGNTNWFTTFNGVAPDYLAARDWLLADGRGFTAVDERAAAKVAVVGATVVEKLFAGQSPIGQYVRINRVPFVVVGVLQFKGQTPFGRDQDDIVMMPLSAAKKRVLGGRQVRGDSVGSITVKVRSSVEVVETERQVTDLLRRRHRIAAGQPDDFYVRNVAQFLEARAESQRTMAFLLAAVAGVSLIVGGIGIMNIMLVSVTERTREIGLRLAVGARSRDIMNQFVIEAMSLSILGGVIGIALGVVGSHVVAGWADWPMIVEPQAIVLAVGFSAAVGVFFGYYPARKASRLDPIDALRHG